MKLTCLSFFLYLNRRSSNSLLLKIVLIPGRIPPPVCVALLTEDCELLISMRGTSGLVTILGALYRSSIIQKTPYRILKGAREMVHLVKCLLGKHRPGFGFLAST